jgi:hypothetical protein
MKRCCMVLLAVVMVTALFAACAKNETPEVTPSEPQTSEPAPPDFSGIDFTGVWSISQVLDSLGVPVSEDKLKDIGADYTIELLDGGMYIIYSAEGKEVGQGEYSVAQDKLIFRAGGGETVYTIQDDNTIMCTAQDGSVTVMTRLADTEEPDTEEPDAVEPDTEQETQ